MSEVQASESVEQLREAAVSALNAADSSDQIESWRVDFLGRKGRLTALLRGLGSLEIEERKVVGAAANLLRADLDSLYEKRERQARSSDTPAFTSSSDDNCL